MTRSFSLQVPVLLCVPESKVAAMGGKPIDGGAARRLQHQAEAATRLPRSIRSLHIWGEAQICRLDFVNLAVAMARHREGIPKRQKKSGS